MQSDERSSAPEHKLWNLILGDLDSETVIKSETQWLLDYIQQYGFLSPMLFSDQIFRKWNQRITHMMHAKSHVLRNVGLILLELTLKHCTYERLLHHMVPWMKLLSDMLRKSLPVSSITLTLDALLELIRQGSKYVDVKRDLAATHLPKVVSALVSALETVPPVEHAAEIFDAVCGLLCITPASLRPVLSRLETYTTEAMRGGDMAVREAAARCACVLPLASPEDHWRPLLGRALNSVALLWDRGCSLLLPGYESEMRDSQKRKEMRDQSVFAGREESNTAGGLKKDWHITLAVLQQLFDFPYPLRVAVPTERIVRLMVVILEANPLAALVGSDPPATALHYHQLVGWLQERVLAFLCILLKRIGEHMVPFAVSLSQVALRGLKASGAIQSSHIRAAFLKFARVLLRTFNAGVYESLAVPLVPILLTHLRSVSASSARSRSSDPLPGARKRKKLTAAEVISAGAAAQQTSEQCFQLFEVQIAALKALEALLVHSGALLVSTVRFDIDKALADLLLHQRSETDTLPYSHARMRYNILRALVASLSTPQNSASPLLPYALQFLSAGLHDSDADVRELSALGLRYCEGLQHPRVAPVGSGFSDAQPLNALAAPTLSSQPKQPPAQLSKPPASKAPASPAPFPAPTFVPPAPSPSAAARPQAATPPTRPSTPATPAAPSTAMSAAPAVASSPTATPNKAAELLLAHAPTTNSIKSPSLFGPRLETTLTPTVSAIAPAFDFSKALTANVSGQKRRAEGDGPDDDGEEMNTVNIVDAEPDEPEGSSTD